MGKSTREEKRAEERRILAEIDNAMAAQNHVEEREKPSKAVVKSGAKQGGKGKKTYYCPGCKNPLDEKGLCAHCGYKMYIPMDEEKRNKIKLILTVVCLVIFAALFVWLQFKK